MLINEELVDKIDTKNYGDGSNNVFVIWTLSLKSSTKSECFKFLGFVHLQSVLVEISSSPEKYYKLRIHQERVMEGMMPGFAPIFPDTCYHLTHYWLAAVDIPVASDNPVHYADAIRYNARTPLQGSLLPLTRLVWA